MIVIIFPPIVQLFNSLLVFTGTQNPKITLGYLKSMMSADGRSVKIIQRIAAGKYKDFGMFLLNDENMTKVGVLERRHIHEGPEGITEAIILNWLQESGSTFHIWQHLIDCIGKCRLDSLAEDIKNAPSGITQF